ncbi:JNK-interacting protein 1 [Cryptotermes secundus]|uniref:JNK-interacting protein 1 n=2 Tax=Cryptotermes secundus TaxID=105785 RepID=A0A2J7NKC7_9NEOP|nr:JNK-interacting protein 1 [Cryptotermes secundus]PNE09425.1 JNK-interacting protein 1 [Cryptotermes secundus]PNE09426.1 JNK-interacting protein 1 [Cryptotermes secundus]
MADTEFEEFRHYFERLPQHIKAPAQSYTLVHDVVLDDDSSTSSKSDGEEELVCCSPTNSTGSEHRRASGDLDDEDEVTATASTETRSRHPSSGRGTPGSGVCLPLHSEEQDAGGKGVHLSNWVDQHRPGPGERRRRKLPEIPKNKKSSVMAMVQPSLADELGELMDKGDNIMPESLQFALGGQTRHLFILKCHSYLRDGASSPDSERFHSTDVDSGNSTAHSPDGPKSMSPQLGHQGSLSPESASPSSSGEVPFTQLELLEATHRGLHKFVPRHHDEIEVEIGDPIYVQKEADDLWCEGVNLRSGRQGIFPSAYAVDMDYSDFDPSAPKVKRERYLLGYLGSVETRCHKGNAVLCQAVRKIVGTSGVPKHKPHSCILEVSDQGLRMVDRRKPSPKDVPCHDYFYSLKNVSFCAFHPRDHRYLGFITKHPQLQRFACHVFMGAESTRPVAEAVGRAFKRFYTKFIEAAYPIEDIYIE